MWTYSVLLLSIPLTGTTTSPIYTRMNQCPTLLVNLFDILTQKELKSEYERWLREEEGIKMSRQKRIHIIPAVGSESIHGWAE